MTFISSQLELKVQAGMEDFEKAINNPLDNQMKDEDGEMQILQDDASTYKGKEVINIPRPQCLSMEFFLDYI